MGAKLPEEVSRLDLNPLAPPVDDALPPGSALGPPLVGKRAQAMPEAGSGRGPGSIGGSWECCLRDRAAPMESTRSSRKTAWKPISQGLDLSL